jgi:hypothetical protein
MRTADNFQFNSHRKLAILMTRKFIALLLALSAVLAFSVIPSYADTADSPVPQTVTPPDGTWDNPGSCITLSEATALLSGNSFWASHPASDGHIHIPMLAMQNLLPGSDYPWYGYECSVCNLPLFFYEDTAGAVQHDWQALLTRQALSKDAAAHTAVFPAVCRNCGAEGTTDINIPTLDLYFDYLSLALKAEWNAAFAGGDLLKLTGNAFSWVGYYLNRAVWYVPSTVLGLFNAFPTELWFWMV